MVYRIYSEKKKELAEEAAKLKNELRVFLGIEGLEDLRILNRYDVENIDPELFGYASKTVFSEPQADIATTEPDLSGARVFAVEFLPGQFDQRADSAAQCVQIISQGERPLIRSAKVYALYGSLSDGDIEKIKKHVINPVEAREASLDKPETLVTEYEKPAPVGSFEGFRELDEEGISGFIRENGLAMDEGDVRFCRDYFRREGRDPTVTEIRVIDTYWSDHCRHTTFGTHIDGVKFEDPDAEAAWRDYLDARRELGRENKPVCLMDVATVGARLLRKRGLLDRLDESEEINACTVKIDVTVNGKSEPWLLLFKNETHNHPTEIEPFGGAATCIGGAIRDPLSGRAYVYGAMRVTGAADPTRPVSETMKGKLPQRKIVTTAAAGYSSYGNQIGLATGTVDEIYHSGYAAKRMEIGAVIAAAPQKNVRRERPEPGDVVILLGGATGRDGCGGATGSSKSHTVESLTACGAEVQKGNAPEERKLQRLFRNERAARLIKRCNDFGAGGVSVAVGELADGLDINLDAVPKKYDGLDGTELAISESQERMAVALAPGDVDAFLALAREENLEATPVATVTQEPRVRMTWRGQAIVDIARDFLASNGAPKSQAVHVAAAQKPAADPAAGASSASTYAERIASCIAGLNACSRKGLVERFDSTIGAGSVLMPFGGTRQLTPALAMVAKFPVLGQTTSVSGMAWGFDPYLSSADQYTGAYLAVVESVSKLVATGFARDTMYLTFQEYFEKLRGEPTRWGKPVASVLGALMAQVDLGVGAIGGKDSMSGSFEDLDVPPTLVSFAVGTGHVDDIVSPEFKKAGSRVVLVAPRYEAGTLRPVASSLVETLDTVQDMVARGDVLAASTCGHAGSAHELFEMCVGNGVGIDFDGIADAEQLFVPAYGSFMLELADGAQMPAETDGVYVEAIGTTTAAYAWKLAGEDIDLAQLQQTWEGTLESVYPCRDAAEVDPAPVADAPKQPQPTRSCVALPAGVAKPRVIVPVFPGTNCEYDTAAAFERAGAHVDTFIVNNLSPQAVADSAHELTARISSSQILMIPGGFSGGDEPDGSAKFITSFFRAPEMTEAVRTLLASDGLILGICNGFQALVKLGLVPYGDIRPMDEECPTLTFNQIGRHQSRIVRTRVASALSPWLAKCSVGDVHSVPISHGEGRFVASQDLLAQMQAAGQIATQYVDEEGTPSMSLDANPNGSVWAIEGITSPDGRILGKMGHSERISTGCYRNIPDYTYQPIIEAGVEYFAG